jgi:tRNA G18 (ribose-2'-O)-methylase SpoU
MEHPEPVDADVHGDVAADDARLDPFRSLRGRESREVLWAEGPTVVERLLRTELTTHALLLTPAAHARLADELDAHAARCRADGRTTPTVLVAPQATVNAVVGFDLHRGAIAVAQRPSPVEVAHLAAGTGPVVVLEGVNDAENLGAVIRTSRALGATGLLLDPTCADPWYRRSVRVSMGEALHLPIARAPLDAALDELRAAGFDTWALTPAGGAALIHRLAPPARLVLVAGAEGPGLTADTLARHRNVRIPMHHEVDSLNVAHAIAAALAIVQTLRHDQH